MMLPSFRKYFAMSHERTFDSSGLATVSLTVTFFARA